MSRSRVWSIVVVVGLLAVTSAGSAVVVFGSAPEQVVEGHITFATLSQASACCNNSTKAAAVAVLVREVSHTSQGARFPGVLWFNDQYLANPFKSNQSTNDTRYPCTGAVLAVNEGDLDPRLYQSSDYLTSYVETYNVTDPNDRHWTINKWNMSGELVWSVSMGGYDHDSTSNFRDDGQCKRNPYKDNAPHKNNPTAYGYPGYAYPCGGVDGPPCAKQLQYNAVLYFLLADLRVNGAPKDHTPGSYNYTHDASGCDENWNNQFKDNWPCPGADDDREGNSHPYNPKPNLTGNQERDTHGWSADCDGDGSPDRLCHGTRYVDLYYWFAPQPIAYNTVIEDDEGRLAPYHCHEDPDPYLDTCV